MNEEIVNWFWCPICRKDVETTLSVSINNYSDLFKSVNVCVDARCVECDNIIKSEDADVNFGSCP